MSDISHQQMEGMSTEALEALTRGYAGEPQQAAEAPVAPVVQAQAPAAVEAPQQAAVETPREQRQEQEQQQEQPAAQAPEQTKDKGDTAIALRQAREATRQADLRSQQIEAERLSLERQHAALVAALKDPDQVESHLKTLRPAAVVPPDYDLDPAGAIKHHLTPVLDELALVKRELAQNKEQQAADKRQQAHNTYMGTLETKYGADYQADIQAFDQQNAHLKDSDPEMKIMSVRYHRGQQAATPPDPAAENARIQALANQQAEDTLAKLLAGGNAPKGITTLGSAPQAKQEGAGVDLNAMGHDAMNKVPTADIQASLRAQYGSG